MANGSVCLEIAVFTMTLGATDPEDRQTFDNRHYFNRTIRKWMGDFMLLEDWDVLHPVELSPPALQRLATLYLFGGPFLG